MTSFNIPISGLTCNHCIKKLENALLDNHNIVIEHISKTSLSINTDSSLTELITTIEQQGYSAGQYYCFHLEGLKCGKCVSKLEQELLKSSENRVLHLSTSKLEIISLAKQSRIIETVESAGYKAVLNSHSLVTTTSKVPPEVPKKHENSCSPAVQPHETMNKIHLLISGMTCASCVASVEKALLSLEPITSAQINLAENSAFITSKISKIELKNQLYQAVESAGYQAEYLDDISELEQKNLTQQQTEQTQHRKNAILGLAVGAPLMIWGILGGNMMIRNSQDQLAWGAIAILSFILLSTAGRYYFLNAWQALTHKRATMDTLVAMGTGAAWLYSTLVIISPTLFPVISRHVYFEASAMIIGLISLGHYIESKAKAGTTRSIQALINLQPNTATHIINGIDKQINIEDVLVGMQLRIKPGEKVPTDAVVISGVTYVDESMLTGEPMPVVKKTGDKVAAGTLNQDGSLVVEASSLGRDSLLSRIIELVRQAQSSKPKIAKLADQISAIFVPTVILIAGCSALVWYFFGPEPKLSYMLVVTTTVLIIACPCALGLATPLSVTAGIGKAAEMGILIRDADVLQTANIIDTVVFDKTGTLTEGKTRVQKIYSFDYDQHELIKMAASVEQNSEHPLARAIVTEAKCDNLPKSDNFYSLPGKGVFATIDHQSVAIVSSNYAREQQWSLAKAHNILNQCISKAWTPVVVAIEEQVVGVIAISDTIKPEAKKAISVLKQRGITPIMLTGDNQTVATAIAEEIGIEQVIAEVLPDGKASHILSLQQQGHKVAMVGDGINDAPALASSDVGIAMGSGSDAALESAQITLLNSSPLTVLHAMEISQATLRNMKQNLFGAFIYNSLSIPIAAGALYPSLGFLLSPVVAGAAMAISSITVVTNANRLRNIKITSRST